MKNQENQNTSSTEVHSLIECIDKMNPTQNRSNNQNRPRCKLPTDASDCSTPQRGRIEIGVLKKIDIILES